MLRTRRIFSRLCTFDRGSRFSARADDVTIRNGQGSNRFNNGWNRPLAGEGRHIRPGRNADRRAERVRQTEPRDRAASRRRAQPLGHATRAPAPVAPQAPPEPRGPTEPAIRRKRPVPPEPRQPDAARTRIYPSALAEPAAPLRRAARSLLEFRGTNFRGRHKSGCAR